MSGRTLTDVGIGWCMAFLICDVAHGSLGFALMQALMLCCFVAVRPRPDRP